MSAVDAPVDISLMLVLSDDDDDAAVDFTNTNAKVFKELIHVLRGLAIATVSDTSTRS